MADLLHGGKAKPGEIPGEMTSQGVKRLNCAIPRSMYSRYGYDQCSPCGPDCG